jgi:predicted amidohydrolase YtcJ
MMIKNVYWSKPKYWMLLLLGIIVFSSCTGTGKKVKADTVFINGHIVTMDDNFPEAEAFATGRGKILDVGSTQEIRQRHSKANIVDLDGQTVMPGIVESHGHLLSLGQSFLELNLEGVQTVREVVVRVRERTLESKAGEWIIGWGWDEGAWAADYPDNVDLSQASPNNPVYLRGLHGFAGWVNDKALEIAGIDAATPNPANGEIIRNPETWFPTGILTNRAQELVTSKIPPMAQEQVEKALILAHQECLKYGLTSVHEARVTRSMLNAFRDLNRRGELAILIYTMLDWTDEDLIDACLNLGPFVDPGNMLTVRCVKIFVDGALGSRGAAFLRPYSDAPGTIGVITTPEAAVYQLTKRSLQSGYQVAVHAIGDLANRITLNAYRRALEEVPVPDHRLRVEHAQVVALDDIPKFAPLGIVVSMQPPHCTSDMPWAEERVGPERILGAYAWRSFLETGIHLALNSDFPGETLNPFYGMYAAETRQSPEGVPEGGWYPDQCLNREEVLKAYTIEAAFSGFEENLKGQIAAGMLADFIVLSADIMMVTSRQLLGLQVEKTYVGGQLKYDRRSQ